MTTTSARTTPTHVAVSNYSPHLHRAAAGWHLAGARYHFWFNVETKKIDGEIIYKNPLLDVDSRHPSYFSPRKLNALAPSNALIVARVFEAIEARNMIGAAISAEISEQRAREEEYKREAREERIRAAGLELLAMLREVVAYIGQDVPSYPCGKRAMYDKARDLLRQLGEE